MDCFHADCKVRLPPTLTLAKNLQDSGAPSSRDCMPNSSLKTARLNSDTLIFSTKASKSQPVRCFCGVFHLHWTSLPYIFSLHHVSLNVSDIANNYF